MGADGLAHAIVQIDLAGAGSPAHDMHRGDRRLLAKDHRDARLQPGILRVADAEAGNVGEEVGGRRHVHIFRGA